MTYLTNAYKSGHTAAPAWTARPEDERFLSIEDMIAFKTRDVGDMESRVVDTHRIQVDGEVDMNNPSRGQIKINYTDVNNRAHQNLPTNWSFGQLARLSGAPSKYLKDLPAPLAADCIQWGLRHNRSRDLIKVYGKRGHGGELRAATGPDYGRIFDHEILNPIKNLIDESGGRWKVAGGIVGNKNGLAVYDPEKPVTKESTTLFASDRDIFVFLVDDRNPISVGTLPNGEPDLMFRGFYAWNSETGSKTAGIASMYLRGVCMNRHLWGVENFQEIKIRHTKFAPERFAAEARPALASFANGSTESFREGVAVAKSLKIASDQQDRIDFLTKRAGLSARLAKAAADRHLKEESKPIESVWDAVQAITAISRDVPHQDSRVQLEKKAGAILDKVA